MSEQDVSVGARVARGVVAGVIAGAVASFAMDRFQAAATALLSGGGGGEDEPATEKAADAIARASGRGEVPEADKPLAGQAVHYVVGIGLGIAYGVAAEFRPAVTAGAGSAFALSTAMLLDEAAVPALGLGKAPWNVPASTSLYSYASHLVFGGVAEVVRRQVAGTLSP